MPLRCPEEALYADAVATLRKGVPDHGYFECFFAKFLQAYEDHSGRTIGRFRHYYLRQSDSESAVLLSENASDRDKRIAADRLHMLQTLYRVFERHYAP